MSNSSKFFKVSVPILFLLITVFLMGALALAQTSIPENCMTLHFDFEEFGVNECANGATIIVHLIDKYPPMAQTSDRLVTLGRMTEKYGKPVKLSTNPPTYAWNRAHPFQRIIALELNGQPGFDVIVLREYDVELIHPTPTPVRGGSGGY